MRDYLLAIALFAILALALTDAIWPKEPPMAIDGATVHKAGGEWCDVNHPPRPKPRVKGLMETPSFVHPDNRSIA